MKYILLLLGVLLAPLKTDGIGCVLACNGFCSTIYKLCTFVQSQSLSCLSTQTTCNLKCAKVCLCVSTCDLECLKPQDACTLKDLTSRKCTAQKALCKRLTCPLKCVTSAAAGIPGLPDLSKLNDGIDMLQQVPGKLFGETSAMMPKALPNLFGSLPSNPFSSKPAEEAAQQTTTNISSFLNPFAKPANTPPVTSPDSENGKSAEPNFFQKAASALMGATKGANLSPNLGSSTSSTSDQDDPNKPIKTQPKTRPPKKSSFFG